jgi:hypothetical protein
MGTWREGFTEHMPYGGRAAGERELDAGNRLQEVSRRSTPSATLRFSDVHHSDLQTGPGSDIYPETDTLLEKVQPSRRDGDAIGTLERSGKAQRSFTLLVSRSSFAMFSLTNLERLKTNQSP